MQAERLQSVTYNGEAFPSTYAIGLVYENNLFEIWGMPGTYSLDIAATTTEEDGGAIKLIFSNGVGATKEISLPKDV